MSIPYLLFTIVFLIIKLLNVGLTYFILWTLTHTYVGLYNIVSDYISPVTHISFSLITLYLVFILSVDPHAVQYVSDKLELGIARVHFCKALVPGNHFWWR